MSGPWPLPDELLTSFRPPASIVFALENAQVSLKLYGGYDLESTRADVRQQIRAKRKQLMKIRQLLAAGQTSEETIADAEQVLLKTAQPGLAPGISDMPADQLLKALESEITEEAADETDWQTLEAECTPTNAQSKSRPSASFSLNRSACSVEIVLTDLLVTLRDTPIAQVVRRIDLSADRLEILDHIQTSTWSKFLTELRISEGGQVRPSRSPMLRFALLFTKEGASTTLSQSIKV